MLKGEFRFANGIVIPNNITKAGAEAVLRAALRAEPISMWVGLVSGAPSSDLQIEDLTEPTIGVNGYERIELSQDDTDWPTVGSLNNEPYVESKDLVWAPTGGAFDEGITRMMIAFDETATTGDVFALSAALNSTVILDTLTEEVDRTLRYRIYLR